MVSLALKNVTTTEEIIGCIYKLSAKVKLILLRVSKKKAIKKVYDIEMDEICKWPLINYIQRELQREKI